MEIFNLDVLAAATVFAVVAKAFVDYVKEPLKAKGIDVWWALYVGFVAGFALSLAAGLNIFAIESLSGVPGQIMTAAYAGGATKIISDVTKRGTISSPQMVELDAENIWTK